MDPDRPQRDPEALPAAARPSFAVHRADGALTLHLHPCPPEILADALEDLGVEIVRGGRDLQFPPALLAALRPPLRVSSDPGVSIHLDAGDHGVIHAADPSPLTAVLRRWIGAHLADAGLPDALDGVGDDALRALLAPIAPEQRSEPRLIRGRRVWTLEFFTYEGVHADPAPFARWIGAERSGWRTDWAW